MKIGFMVNDVETEKAGFTTTRLACEAINRGHEVYIFGVGDLAYDPMSTSAPAPGPFQKHPTARTRHFSKRFRGRRR